MSMYVFGLDLYLSRIYMDCVLVLKEDDIREEITFLPLHTIHSRTK